MKKALLLSLVLVFGMTAFAQVKQAPIPKALENKVVATPAPLVDFYGPLQYGNSVTAPKASPLATTIGGTRYDAQTNGTMHKRIVATYDNVSAKYHISGIWTKGQADPNYADRGTGYNYFGGDSWGTAPTARIETVRTGWPSHDLLGSGEVVIAHQSGTLGLIMSKRAVRGTGAWTQTTIAPPSGATGLLWPSLITSGPTNNYIHMLALTSPTGNSGTVYQGLDGALLYFRSSDGGATWDKPGVIIDPLNSSNYFGFGADSYAWGSPHGDTIYFVVGDNWTDTFLMVSTDNGETWTRTEILSNAHKMDNSTTACDPFYCCDGSLSVELDYSGVFHVAFGRMCALNDGTGRFYRPYTDGLVYWNSTMPQLQDSLYLDTLYAHGQLLGYVYPDAAGDSIVGIPYYGEGMTSYPQISIDDCMGGGNICVIYSAITVGNPYNGLNYRHIWERHSTDGGVTWSDSNDLNHGLAYIYKEFVYPSMSKFLENSGTSAKYRFIYQSADVPGSAIKDATNVTVHDNTIEEREGTFTTPVCAEGVNEHPASKVNEVYQNVPNPFNGITTVDVQVAKAGSLSLDVYNLMGQKMMNMNKGQVSPGVYQFAIDGSRLSPGIYFYTVNVGNESFTNKMVVK
jgi:hypothetical protein